MKKDIEWAKNRIKNTLKFEASNEREVGFKIAMQEALEIIDQLDESKTLSIDKEQLIKRIENYIPLHDKTVGDVVNGILEIVKQLPEMEVLSPEWIVDNTQLDMNPTSRVVPVFLLENLLVPKQEKPVIPQSVADWLEEYKEDELIITAGTVIGNRRFPKDTKVAKWLNEDYVRNSEVFAQAWLAYPNIEVEE